jgi:ubiquinone/menaquinone biosynthesis C-methylase UbiE
MAQAKITDYDAWSLKYDETRSVSSSVLEPLLEALGLPSGRSLLDIGGGTGNYSVALRNAGFVVIHCDPSPGMVRRAASKLAPENDAIVADGQKLPFSNGSFDCGVAVKVLNHVADRPAFMREAKRVLCNGPFVLVNATKETIESNWITHYIPALLRQERFQAEAKTVAELGEAGFSPVEVQPIRYTDMDDGSAQALKRFPEALLTDERIMNTSLLSRLHDNVRRDALAAIRQDYNSGRLREVMAEYETLSERYGDGTMFVARK